MKANRKPKIALLGIMQELYDEMIPGITKHQESYARSVAAELKSVVDPYFPGAARNRADIERYVEEFNRGDYDGIMIFMLTYSPGLRLYNALRANRLPIMLANIQPEPSVGANWNMDDLTYNQGIHGAQDTANAILRWGIPCPVISDDWRSDAFRAFVGDWGRAAQTARAMQTMRIAAVGQMPGMGDILTDHAALMKRLGPQVDQVAMGAIHKLFEKVSDADVDKVVAENRKNFQIDPKLQDSNHRYAARFQVAIKRMLEEGDFDGFSIYFNSPGDDGRFKQIHMMAASNLMAEGYGYSAEGDTCSAVAVTAGQILAGDAHFTEMYAMDFTLNSSLQSHMGEGNWKVARKDRPVRLIDRPLGIGKLDNPPTVLFMAQPGPATLVSLVSLDGGKYRAVVARGEVLDTPELVHVEMPYFHFRPETGVRACLDGWLANGGTHHQVMNLGDQTRRWKLLCRQLGIEYVAV